MLDSKNGVVRIGVFYDGNYFLHVSNYYNYFHSRRRRISIAGLHTFIRQQVAEEMQAEYRLCHVVDAHYFRGRMSAYEASQRGNQLYNDRLFDDVLMSEGVVTHYLPLRNRGFARLMQRFCAFSPVSYRDYTEQQPGFCFCSGSGFRHQT